MWKELLQKAFDLLNRGNQLQSISKIGTDENDLGEYMLEREKFLNDVTKYLTDMPTALEKEFDQINEELKRMKDNVAVFSQPEKELTKKEVFKAVTRAALYAHFGMRAFSTDEAKKSIRNIIVSGSFATDKAPERQLFITKDAIDTPLDPGGTNAGYTINPIYERELIKYAAEKSDMMPYVRRLPMLAPTHSFPMLSSRSFVMTRTAATSSGTTWSASSKMADSATGPTFGARVELQATTLAAYIPWIDEFRDDLQLNESLEALMSECFLEAYAEDFDKNVLTADTDDSDQYDGLLNTDNVLSYVCDSSSIQNVSPHNLRTALQKISRMERDGGYWILNESVLDALAQVRNAVGDYLFWVPPTGDMPGKIAGRPYIEAHMMPDYEEILPGDVFMAYAKPENLWVGERAGLEVRQFDATTYALEYQENFTRWRLRNGFKTVKPEAALLLKLRT
jgi:HK97 family phage major capsid protein